MSFQGFHDGQRSAKGRILACPEECCSKLWAVAKAVAANKQKALVMTSRSCGYLVILALLRRLARESCPTFEVATMEELAEFNHISNASGQVPWTVLLVLLLVMMATGNRALLSSASRSWDKFLHVLQGKLNKECKHRTTVACSLLLCI